MSEIVMYCELKVIDTLLTIIYGLEILGQCDNYYFNKVQVSYQR